MGERIYVRLPNWVGDVVMAEPALRALRRSFPEARIVAHGKGHTLGFIEAAGHFDEAVPLQRRGGVRWPLLEGRRLRAEQGRFDRALILPNSLSSALIPWVMGARRRYGYRLNGRWPLLTHALPVRKVGRLRPIPMVSYYLKLAAAAGADIADIPHRPALPASEASRAAAAELWSRAGVADEDRVWALNVGGAWPTKQYPVENTIALARLIAASGRRILLLGGPDEADMTRAVRAQLGAAAFGMPEDGIGLGDLIAALQRCELLISSDSGPRHFGVAADVPTLALIGPTHPAYTGVDSDRSGICCLQLECWPCHHDRCPLPEPEHHACLRDLAPELAFSAATQLLQDCQPSQPA